jgi:hypothetical protein
MTRFKLIGTAAILSLLSATPALAQHMIDEPGMFAFTYPMGDLGIGSSRPPVDAMAMMRSDPRMKSHVMTTRRARPGK